MLRQVGLAIGVAVLIAVLGSPRSPAATLAAYQRSWIVIAGISAAGAVLGLVLLAGKRRRTSRETVIAGASLPAVAAD